MEKTNRILLSLFIISGLLFTACNSAANEVEDATKFEVTVNGNDAFVQDVPAVGNENVDDMTEAMGQNSMMMSTYADGTYSNTGMYFSPSGPETVGVTLVIVDDTVSSVSIDVYGASDTSILYQTAFSEGISSLVNGVSLADLGTFSSVNGGSLTPKGFATAVSKIKAQAQI